MKDQLKRFWAFLKEDSWQSFVVSLVLTLLFIKFVFFPVLTFLTGTPLPLVIVESCSMYHSTDLETIMENKIYSDYDLSYENSSDWSLKRGFTKGDIIFVVSPKNLEVGDVAIFAAGTGNPIIHRVINLRDDGSFTTKGDNNFGLLPYEKDISQQQAIGKAVFKIPLLGWVKLIFFDFQKPESERGFCG